MMYVVVDIADMKVSDQPDDILITYSLGSCLGIALYDPIARVGGLLHCMLPLSRIDQDKARNNPNMFCDTGMTQMMQKLYDMGATKKNMIVKVAGGASLLDEKKIFNIGERNFIVLNKVLEVNKLKLAASDVGGTISRTVFLNMDTGLFIVKSGGKEVEL